MEKKLKLKIIKVLRRDSYKSGVYKKVYERTYKTTEGKAFVHGCEICKNLFKRKEMQVDHILSVIPLHTDEENCDLYDYIERLYCNEKALQHLCKECHQDKTQFENHLRKLYKTGIIKKEILDEKLLEYLKDIKR